MNSDKTEQNEANHTESVHEPVVETVVATETMPPTETESTPSKPQSAEAPADTLQPASPISSQFSLKGLAEKVLPWLENSPAVPWIILGLAFVLRALWLDMKPFQFDEGVNGWIIDDMTRKGFYHYDPANYHGPFHFYVLFLMQTLFGREMEAYRFPLVLANVATVWFFIQFQRFIPRALCLIAALAFAVSPGMIFYSRYAIHEAWLVLGMVMALWGAAELWFRGSARGVWALAMGMTLMILVKETYIVHVICFGLAILTLKLLERFIPSAPTEPPAKQTWTKKQLLDALLASVFLIAFFYSGGFMELQALLGLTDNIIKWLHTGISGSNQSRPWHYWLELFSIYELPVLIGLVYCIRIFKPGMNRYTRLIGIYGLGVLCAYSIVKYKTPWCVIAIIWPFMFLFAEAITKVIPYLRKETEWPWANKNPQLAAGFLAAGILLVSLGVSIRLNYFKYTAIEELYANVQTRNDIYKLTGAVEKLLKVNPTGYTEPINIILNSYHPIPWMLGECTRVTFYEDDKDKPKTKPEVYDAGILVVAKERIEEAEAELKQEYFTEPFRFRDDMRTGKLYLNRKLFAEVYPNRTPEFVPTPK